MSKKELLSKVKREYESRKCVEIHLIWSNGEKAGIGNPEAIRVVMNALKMELDRQINES